MTALLDRAQQHHSSNATSPALMVRAAAITGALLTLAAMWVPIDFGGSSLTSNLFDELQPRALAETIIVVLNLGNGHFILMRQLFQAFWLFLIVLEFARSLRSERGSQLFEVISLGFLFCFNTVVFTTNGLGVFVDVVPYALILCAVPLIFPRDGHHTIPRWAFSNGLLVLAVVAHEKSIFDLAILIVWGVWKYGPKRSAMLFWFSLLGSALFLSRVSTKQNSLGGTVEAYIESIQTSLPFLLAESLNVWGIFLSGGMLWGILAAATYYFLKTQTEFGLRGMIAIAIMVFLCLAPLLVAHDTIRMVGLMWLPTFLLIRELDLKSFLVSIHFRRWALPLCVAQLLLPPVLLYQHGVAPFNCYSKAIVSLLPSSAEMNVTTITPFSLYKLDRKDISDRIVCWPPRPIRGEHRFWPY